MGEPSTLRIGAIAAAGLRAAGRAGVPALLPALRFFGRQPDAQALLVLGPLVLGVVALGRVLGELHRLGGGAVVPPPGAGAGPAGCCAGV